MVGEFDRERLDDRLIVWEGPPPRDLSKFPELLPRMCGQAGADTVVVDSLKDAAVGLNDDEVGASWNRARQKALRDGVEVLELHHMRKRSGAGESAPTIDSVYGSTWITSGCGSVVMLTGEPGDPLVGFNHVKQPMNTIGPLKVRHDHDTGRSEVWGATDLVDLARGRRDGLSAMDAAAVLFDTDQPTPNDREKARRKLEALTRQGVLRVVRQGDRSAADPALKSTLWGAP